MTTATIDVPIPTGENRRAARDALWKLLGYKPTPEQEVIHDSPARIRLVTGGEGSGKSHLTAIEIVERVPRLKNGLIWIIAAEYDDCREEFKYTVDWLSQMGYLAKDPSYPSEGQCSLVAINGCVVVTKSAKDPIKIGRESPDFIAVVEAAKISYEAYQRIRGRIARNRGEMLLSGSLEGSLSWYPEFAIRWSAPNNDEAESFSLPTWTNTYKYPGGRTDPEIVKLQEQNFYEYFLERYGGVICKPSGLVVKEFSNRLHVRDCLYNPDLPVEIAVDPGYFGAHVVLPVQMYPDYWEVIDEIYLQGYVTSEIIKVCQQRWPWYDKITGGAIDIAAKQHQAMPAPIEIWRDEGHISLQCQKVDVEKGIERLRSFLMPNPVTGLPKIFFDHKCRGVTSECGGGKSPVHGAGPWLRDANTGKALDKDNHGCKAIIYLIVNKFGYSERGERQAVSVRRFY